MLLHATSMMLVVFCIIRFNQIQFFYSIFSLGIYYFFEVIVENDKFIL